MLFSYIVQPYLCVPSLDIWGRRWWWWCVHCPPQMGRCDCCRKQGYMTEKLQCLGSVRNFCNMQCVLHYCFVHFDKSQSGSGNNGTENTLTVSSSHWFKIACGRLVSSLTPFTSGQSPPSCRSDSAEPLLEDESRHRWRGVSGQRLCRSAQRLHWRCAHWSVCAHPVCCLFSQTDHIHLSNALFLDGRFASDLQCGEQEPGSCMYSVSVVLMTKVWSKNRFKVNVCPSNSLTGPEPVRDSNYRWIHSSIFD